MLQFVDEQVKENRITEMLLEVQKMEQKVFSTEQQMEELKQEVRCVVP